MTARAEQEVVLAELVELRALASRLLERITKLQGELTAGEVPANDADLKPRDEDFIALRARRKKRGQRG